MDYKECLEVLELNKNASLSQVKQAYKDIVSVWHPDRFSNNPRLRLKAEEKLKKINKAYEILCTELSQNSAGRTSYRKQDTGNEQFYGKVSKTEAIFETGTELVLNLFSQLSSAFRQIRKDIDAEVKKGDTTGGQGQ